MISKKIASLKKTSQSISKKEKTFQADIKRRRRKLDSEIRSFARKNGLKTTVKVEKHKIKAKKTSSTTQKSCRSVLYTKTHTCYLTHSVEEFDGKIKTLHCYYRCLVKGKKLRPTGGIGGL